jgi:hypothetical protein
MQIERAAVVEFTAKEGVKLERFREVGFLEDVT